MNDAATLFRLTDRELWVVTSQSAGRSGGLIATFVDQASIVPECPRVLVGIARSHHTWGLIESSGAFALHLIGEHHLDWVWRFGLRSGRDGDKFVGIALEIALTGSPILSDALGWLDCRVEERLETGDRTVYLGEVVEARLPRQSAPLTAQRMVQLAPPEKLDDLRRQMQHDVQLDAAAIRTWRAQHFPKGRTRS